MSPVFGIGRNINFDQSFGQSFVSQVIVISLGKNFFTFSPPSFISSIGMSSIRGLLLDFISFIAFQSRNKEERALTLHSHMKRWEVLRIYCHFSCTNLHKIISICI